MIFCDHIVSVDEFKILPTSDSYIHVKVKESLLILRDEPVLNKNETYLSLYLFRNYILIVFTIVTVIVLIELL